MHARYYGRHSTFLHYQALVERQVSILHLRPVRMTNLELNNVLKRYKRIFCIGKQGISTLNPGSTEVTNQVVITVQISHWYHSLALLVAIQ